PALQQKGLSRRDRRQALLQAPGLAGKDEWGETPKSLLDIGECGFVGVTGYLADRQAAPAVGAPVLAHHSTPPGWRPLHHRRHRIGRTLKHESRLGGRLRGTRKRDPRPPSYTGGTKIVRSGRGTRPLYLPCPQANGPPRWTQALLIPRRAPGGCPSTDRNDERRMIRTKSSPVVRCSTNAITSSAQEIESS